MKLPTFAMVPGEVLRDQRLQPTDIRVLIALLLFANKRHRCWPGRKLLSEITGLPIAEISRRTTRLSKLGWLTKEGRGGYNRPCIYTITIPADLPKTVIDSGTVSVSDTVQDKDANDADFSQNAVLDSSTRIEQTKKQKENRLKKKTTMQAADIKRHELEIAEVSGKSWAKDKSDFEEEEARAAASHWFNVCKASIVYASEEEITASIVSGINAEISHNRISRAH